MNWRFYVYNITPKFRARKLWRGLQAHARLPLLYPKDPWKKGMPEPEVYAFKTRLFLDDNGAPRRTRAICYSFQANEERASDFFTAIAAMAPYGARFVIRDKMTNAWFKTTLAKEPEEVANRVRALMGPAAIPPTYRWGRKGDPRLVTGPGSDLDTE